jgi:hypothetical protein
MGGVSGRLGCRLATMMVLCILFSSTTVTAQSPLGVEIDCNNKSPKLNVHPIEHDSVTVTCTVRNTGSLEEQIDVEKELEEGQPSIDMILSEDSFTLAADEEETFQVTFSSSQTRLSATILLDFSLVAKVNQAGVFPVDALNTTAEVSGKLGIEKYGMVEIERKGVSTLTMSESEEESFQFVFRNNGNDRDKIKVSIKNEQELLDMGFSFPLGTFVAEDVDENSQSQDREMTIRSPKEIKSSDTVNIILVAESTNEPSSPKSEVKITVNLEASSSNSGIGTNLDEVSKDDVIKYGGIAGASLLALVILILAVKSVGRKSNDKVVFEAPRPIEVQDDEDDDFDDLLDSLEEFDDPDDFESALDEF